MSLASILWKHCPQRAKHGKGLMFAGADGLVSECPTCSPFRIALEEAKRDGYQIALRLFERSPASAVEVLKSLIEAKPPG